MRASLGGVVMLCCVLATVAARAEQHSGPDTPRKPDAQSTAGAKVPTPSTRRSTAAPRQEEPAITKDVEPKAGREGAAKTTRAAVAGRPAPEHADVPSNGPAPEKISPGQSTTTPAIDTAVDSIRRLVRERAAHGSQARREPPAARSTAVLRAAKENPRRVTLVWRLSLDWPSELMSARVLTSTSEPSKLVLVWPSF